MEQDELFIDTETYSPVPIKQGTARYATQVEVMIVTWALNEEPVSVWDVTRCSIPPAKLIADLKKAERVIAHNAQFDRTVLDRMPWWREIVRSLGRPINWYCTMAMALRHGLPGGLDKLTKIFRLSEEHAKVDGKEYIRLFCTLPKGETRATRLTHPQKWREFLKYAAQDIYSMREVYFKCPSWNDTAHELALTELDYTINTRGVAVDVPFVRNAVRACIAEQARLADKTQDLTSEYVDRATQRDRLLEFIFVEHGISLPDLKADTVERRLDDPELPPLLKELLRVRLSASKASTSKYKSILTLQEAGRLYFLLQIYGALRTGRWSGRNFQPQNLPRPKAELFDTILAYITAINSGHEDVLLENVMQAASDCLRSAIIAGPGKKLVVSDLSNIEGRALPWLAGDEPMLEYFRAFDAAPKGTMPDYYQLVYGRAFNVDPMTVKGQKRQIGKVLELAFAIGGGVGACVTAAATYKIDLDELADAVWASAPRQILLDAAETYLWAKKKRMAYTQILTERVYVACEALKVMWRASRQPTVDFWDACQMAAVRAINCPGRVFKAGEHLEFDRKGVWLRMRLPSGRYLGYPCVEYDEQNGEISYMAWNVYRNGWYRERTYGSKLASDARQAMSRDVMAAAMLPAEEAGYPVILTVHDELVTEPLDDPQFTAKRLSEIMARPLPWAPGLPLAASGFEGSRYRKQ